MLAHSGFSISRDQVTMIGSFNLLGADNTAARAFKHQNLAQERFFLSLAMA
jgi:hypothetical protein